MIKTNSIYMYPLFSLIAECIKTRGKRNSFL